MHFSGTLGSSFREQITLVIVKSRITVPYMSNWLIYIGIPVLLGFWAQMRVSGAFKRYSFQLGWVPPHPTFYMRKEVAQKVGDYDLSYITTADYDYMLRALALNNFRVSYIPRVLADFQIGGISTRGWRVTARPNLECLRSRRAHLNAPIIDAAFFLRFIRRIFQIRKFRTVRAGRMA